MNIGPFINFLLHNHFITEFFFKKKSGEAKYYRYHIKKGLVLGKGLKIVRYQTFISKRNQTLKRKEKKAEPLTVTV